MSYRANVEDLLRQYADTVYRIARVQMKNNADADDVFQEVFLRLVRYSDRIKSPEHAKFWLIRVTLNCCKNQFSSLANNGGKNCELLEETATAPQEDDERSDLLNAIGELSCDQKSAVYLHYFEGYSVEEIARITKQNANTVKSHLFRARQALKNKLGAEIYE